MDNVAVPPADCRSRLIRLLPGIYYQLRHNQRWEVISVTERSVSLLGYAPQEIYHLSSNLFEKVIHPDDFVALRDQKYQAMQEDKLYVSEYRMYSKLQEVKFVRDQYTCFEQDGQWFMEGYVCEIAPSGIRDRLLQQLKAYRNAVDFNMISSITDVKGKILYANENFCKISKYAQWELVGQNHRIINSQHHPKKFFEDMWNTISSGQPWHGEILNKAKDGSLYWVDTVIMPIFDESKKITSYLSLRLLINDRKEGELHKQNYIKVLEKIAFAVSHEVRSPVCSILGLVDLLQHYQGDDLDKAVALNHLSLAADQLNLLTKKMSVLVHESERELKRTLSGKAHDENQLST